MCVFWKIQIANTCVDRINIIVLKRETYFLLRAKAKTGGFFCQPLLMGCLIFSEKFFTDGRVLRVNEIHAVSVLTHQIEGAKLISLFLMLNTNCGISDDIS